MTERYAAQFEFFSAAKGEEYSCFTGSVVVREAETVLDSVHSDDFHYTIVGRDRGGTFEGTHQGSPDHISVSAKWVLLDDVVVGTWIENRTDFVLKVTRTHE